MQYLYKYTNVLDERGIDYDVIYWNREGLIEKNGFNGNSIEFKDEIDSYQPIRKKIKSFIKYSYFIRKKLDEKKYDRIIVLTTQTACSIFDILLFKYKGKYIFDYRDVTKELSTPIFKNCVRLLISNSKYTMMSSPGFINLLGVKKRKNVQIAHNTQGLTLSDKAKTSVNKTGKITISFWGTIRQMEFNKKVCDLFGNDDRFIVYFHGKGLDKELKAFCDKRHYSNVIFTGRYNTDKITDFVDNTDILHCLYENDKIQKLAMPVKAYDAIKYRIPLLVSRDSEVERFYFGKKCALSLNIDDGDKVKKEIYSWYRGLSFEELSNEFDMLNKKIEKDDKEFKRKLLCFIFMP